jgi:mannose-6-phosphate isomerase-like protein (cupin superfamily)
MSQAIFENVLAASKAVYDHTPLLQSFGMWPQNMTFQSKPATPVPAMRQIKAWHDPHPLHIATQEAAAIANWKQTYTEEEVGFGFLQDYGYIELFGPDGHFYTTEMRGYIAYWGRGLYYPWHHHEAEEIYCVVSGSGMFEAHGTEPKMLGSGACQFHASNQPHALTMKDGPILALVLWRGKGMADLPLMGTA